MDNHVVVTNVTSGVDNGIPITDGKRLIASNLSLYSFNLGSINVYGKDEFSFLDSELKGFMQFEIKSWDGKTFSEIHHYCISKFSCN